MAITEGDITTSDHIPIIVKISTKPIIKEIKKTKDFKNVDWDRFRDIIEEKTDRQDRQIPLQDRRINKDIIDIAMKTWIDDIADTIDDITPTKQLKYYIHPRESDLIKVLEMTYDTLKTKDSWTIEDRQMLRQIQQQIKDEATRLANLEWDKTIKDLQDCYGDATKFWKKSKQTHGR